MLDHSCHMFLHTGFQLIIACVSVMCHYQTAQNSNQLKNSTKTWFLSNKCACSFCNKCFVPCNLWSCFILVGITVASILLILTLKELNNGPRSVKLVSLCVILMLVTGVAISSIIAWVKVCVVYWWGKATSIDLFICYVHVSVCSVDVLCMSQHSSLTTASSTLFILLLSVHLSAPQMRSIVSRTYSIFRLAYIAHILHSLIEQVFSFP